MSKLIVVILRMRLQHTMAPFYKRQCGKSRFLPLVAALCLDDESSWMLVVAHASGLHESGSMSPEYLQDFDD